jgi:hypothetical protein
MLKGLEARMDGFVPLPDQIWEVRSDVLAMRAVLEGARTARNREETLSVLADLSDLCDAFFRFTTCLLHNLKGKGFTQFATLWDMATVGSLALHDLMDGRWRQLKDLLASAFSEGSMIMASLQYVRAAEENLKTVTDEHASFLYGKLWGVALEIRKGLTPAEAREAQKGLDDFFSALKSEGTPIETRMVVLLQIYMIMLKIRMGMLLGIADEKVLTLDV